LYRTNVTHKHTALAEPLRQSVNKQETLFSEWKYQPTNYCFTAIIQVNLRQPASPVKNRRILLLQSFTARMPLLTAISAFGLGRRRRSSPQQYYRRCLCILNDENNEQVHSHVLYWMRRTLSTTQATMTPRNCMTKSTTAELHFLGQCHNGWDKAQHRILLQ